MSFSAVRWSASTPDGPYDDWYDRVTVNQLMHHASGLDHTQGRTNPIVETE
jgi:CubicO group peptidase (beta-lactamase class C family)